MLVVPTAAAVDEFAPDVTGVRITDRPQDGVAYGTGERIDAYLRFSQDVVVTGSPTLVLSVGAETKLVPLSSSNGQYLWFRHTVRAGDAGTDGVSILTGALALNRESIRSVARLDTALELGSHAIIDDPEHKVEGG